MIRKENAEMLVRRAAVTCTPIYCTTVSDAVLCIETAQALELTIDVHFGKPPKEETK